MKKSVRVDIFGHEYILKAEADDEHIRKVAEFVDHKMKEVSITANTKNVLNIAIIAALNIAEEYLKIKHEREKAENKARALAEMIDANLRNSETANN